MNLESNQLSGDGEDNLGITELILGLQNNKSLLSLNLSNNKLRKDEELCEDISFSSKMCH